MFQDIVAGATPESSSCRVGVGVVAPFRGVAQVGLHGDQLVELSVLLGVHQEGGMEEDGKDRSKWKGRKVKSKRNAPG